MCTVNEPNDDNDDASHIEQVFLFIFFSFRKNSLIIIIIIIIKRFNVQTKFPIKHITIKIKKTLYNIILQYNFD